MKVLLTGANGYVGTRLLPLLVEQGHEVVALVRSPRRITIPDNCRDSVTVVVGDLLKPHTLNDLPFDIEAAYYLVHSMSQNQEDFQELEAASANNFVQKLSLTQCRQIIYLSGLAGADKEMSPHLASRSRVETLLRASKIPVTVLRAGIVMGSGSASFEIIRDLVEKLPVMIAPKWVRSRCQPIGIYDLLHYLSQVLGNEKAIDRTFDIGGEEVLTYEEMMMRFAKVRGLHRLIIKVPVLSPRLSSYWLYFVTTTNYSLARTLVDSLKSDSICRDDSIREVVPHRCFSYETMIRRAFMKIEQNAVVSSWKDAVVTGSLSPNMLSYVEVPQQGCLSDGCELPIEGEPEEVIDRIFSIGGNNGWLYWNWAWKLRGYLDKILGGIGLRRGRRSPTDLKAGDALDFWRVVVADRKKGRLLLYAEMRLPGEAWLEMKVVERKFVLKAIFRPLGLFGRLYWYILVPAHLFIFRGLGRALVTGKS